MKTPEQLKGSICAKFFGAIKNPVWSLLTVKYMVKGNHAKSRNVRLLA